MSLTNPPIIPERPTFNRRQTVVLCGLGSLGALLHNPPHAQRVYTHAHMGLIYILPTSQKVKKVCGNRELRHGRFCLIAGTWEVCPHE